MKHVLIYTDGACSGNPGPGGWGAVLQLAGQPHRRELSGGFRLTTNNRMELRAAIEALGALKEACLVTLHTDSQYLSNAVQKGWLAAWQKQKFIRKGGKPVPNTDLWQCLLPYLKQHKISLVWLRGHAGHPENERCDELARSFCRKDNLPPDTGYEAQLANAPAGGLSAAARKER